MGTNVLGSIWRRHGLTSGENNGTYTSSDDCYYANCTFLSPDWVFKEILRTTILDQDDISGTGQKTLPCQPCSWNYTVVVHDHTSNNYVGMMLLL